MLEKSAEKTGASCMHSKEAYTTEGLRAILGVSRSTVLGILRADLFPHSIANGRCAIPKVSFDKWLHDLQAEENT